MSRALERVELAPGYRIGRVVNGCWQLSAGHENPPPEADAVLEAWQQLAQAGFTTFDCADIYTGVEELLGKFVARWRDAGRDADAIQIHTKYVPDLDDLARLSRRKVEAIVDRSLERLGLERLDLVQFSWWDYATPGYVEAAVWLDELRKAGKIRLVGATNFDVPRLCEILDAGVPIAAHQIQYSLLDRRPEHGMVELCRERGVPLVAYGALAGGFLSDRWLDANDPEQLENRSLVKYRVIVEEFGGWSLFQELLVALAAIAARHGATIGSVAARWVLDQPGVGAIIAGAKDARHAGENLRLAELELSSDDQDVLNEILLRATGPGGDTFELERVADGPHAAIMRRNLNSAA